VTKESTHGGKTIGSGSEEDFDLHPEREVVSVGNDVLNVCDNGELVVVGITGARCDDGHESNSEDDENGETFGLWSDVEGLDNPDGVAKESEIRSKSHSELDREWWDGVWSALSIESPDVGSLSAVEQVGEESDEIAGNHEDGETIDGAADRVLESLCDGEESAEIRTLNAPERQSLENDSDVVKLIGNWKLGPRNLFLCWSQWIWEGFALVGKFLVPYISEEDSVDSYEYAGEDQEYRSDYFGLSRCDLSGSCLTN